ncbi:methionyl-tRNA formyltransferase [Amylibacter sp. IMCC11727]|uniref:methionyl-tRNA formyltransferase n=1 Tax=Amylibacter sp. IMCC11727 TaxID=3039851 RepID=UPI00244DD832|nr:methionyl-tRNA formyltransferase [Amylibacter sp. IMCC11727]WGI22520.1 methionyl-tRNA formyltransferase [Amylibacter sp. IMCC11727]
MKVVFMGTPEFSVPILEGIVAAGHEVCAVYCQPPRPAGRGKKDRPSAVQVAAERLGLPVRHPVNFKDTVDVAAFEALNADVGVVVAYGLILPQVMLDAPTKGCLNIHASLLPRWRGAAPIHRAIMAGDSETGVCVMQMEAGLDTGPVRVTVRTDILASDTTGVLHDRLSIMGRDAILDVLADGVSGDAITQSKEGVVYAAKIDKAEAEVDWSRPAGDVDCHIRGLSPFPGAWTMMEEQRVKLLMSTVAGGSGAAGVVINDALRVACGEGAVDLIRLQRAGKGAMDVDAFLQGFPVANGARLGGPAL